MQEGMRRGRSCVCARDATTGTHFASRRLGAACPAACTTALRTVMGSKTRIQMRMEHGCKRLLPGMLWHFSIIVIQKSISRKRFENERAQLIGCGESWDDFFSLFPSYTIWFDCSRGSWTLYVLPGRGGSFPFLCIYWPHLWSIDSVWRITGAGVGMETFPLPPGAI